VEYDMRKNQAIFDDILNLLNKIDLIGKVSFMNIRYINFIFHYYYIYIYIYFCNMLYINNFNYVAYNKLYLIRF